MKLTTCEYCGTDYDASLRQCPLCGKTAVFTAEPVPSSTAPVADRGSSKPGKRLAPKPEKPAMQPDADNPYAIPKGMMIAICVILAMAVLAGAAFAIYNLKWFDPKESPFLKKAQTEAPKQEQVQQSAEPELPAQPTERDYTNEEDYAAKNPEPAPQETVTCTGLTLSVPTVTFDEPGLFFNISYKRQPEACAEEVFFSSSDEDVATVNQQGKIVAVNSGTAQITALCGTKSAKCLVTCDFPYVSDEEPEPEQLPEEATSDTEPQTPAVPPSLNNTDMTFFSKGEQFQLEVRDLPEGVHASFASSNPAVAEVTSAGLVTAAGSGTTTVTATLDGGQTLSCIVRCGFADVTASADSTGCELSHSDVTMSIVGEYFKLSLKDAGGNSIKGLSWVSSDPTVCTVSSDGIVTALTKGTAYVSTNYGGESFECIVRCNIH